ncbi:MAG: 4Fe-4S binding protein, partial [Phycisphaerae bacterium]
PVGALPTKAKGAAGGRSGLTLLVDPVTLWALGGIAQGEAAILERPLEIFAMGQTPRLIKATLGTPLSDLLSRYGLDARGKQCIVNGMLAGVEMNPQRAAVESATAIISLRDFPSLEKPSECFQCGWCVDHCPTGLNPRRLSLLAVAKGGSSSSEAAEALNCIGCGLCSYVCPTRLPLTQEVLGLRGAKRRDLYGRQDAQRLTPPSTATPPAPKVPESGRAKP